jgi:shikimate dehydrogenase
METMQALKVELVAVTMPFKEKILTYLHESTDAVKALQAANTLICRDGKWSGYNTDVDGIAYALRAVVLSNKNLLLLGAGGAARAAGYFFQQHAVNLFWLNRTTDKAKQLAKLFGGKVLTEETVQDAEIDIVINTTPIGLFPDVDVTPLVGYTFQPQQVVFDMVYNPMQTLLLQQAQATGARIISGMEMFIGQGLRQIELWQGRALQRIVSSLLKEVLLNK